MIKKRGKVYLNNSIVYANRLFFLTTDQFFLIKETIIMKKLFYFWLRILILYQYKIERILRWN